MVLVVDRLVASTDVDDAEAPVAEGDAVAEEIAVGVRAAMGQCGGHSPKTLPVHRASRVSVHDARDAAHGQMPCQVRRPWST